MLIILPLYPKPVGDFVYAVNLLSYGEIAPAIRIIYWILFSGLILLGLCKILWPQSKVLTGCSMVVGILTVLLLALAGETYAVTVAFGLLTVKGTLLLRCSKDETF